ncbi:hypothetical protein KFL_002460145 [Klebsormidium nitens]|uniref:Uncharacterized protein n=1 Tax=Klebsormidium nitens TaxID=105231 RepID=A0A1Y1I882_KLENI|nr:hypothetical protein KFL_002460145 [Klebsormidium nitens]|eukprot:GAQ85639.1 hypothetical protein KFL_002460145 [Klebsormidium nitens]
MFNSSSVPQFLHIGTNDIVQLLADDWSSPPGGEKRWRTGGDMSPHLSPPLLPGGRRTVTLHPLSPTGGEFFPLFSPTQKGETFSPTKFRRGDLSPPLMWGEFSTTGLRPGENVFSAPLGEIRRGEGGGED